MEQNEYKQLKEQVEQKYQNAILMAETERNEAIQAIEIVWRMLKGDTTEVARPDSEPLFKSTRRATKQVNGYGSLTSTVKHLIDTMPKRFTKNDIRKALSKELDRDIAYNSLDGCVRRLKKQGLIKIVLKGKGRRPNKYSKVDKDGEFF